MRLAAPIVLRAVQPNAGTTEWYRRKLVELLRQMHESMRLHIEAAYKREPPTIGFASDASSTAELQRTLTRWGRHWSSKMADLSSDMARDFAARSARDTQNSMMDALKAGGFAIKFEPTMAAKEAYRAVIAQNVNLIRSIPQQYLKDVQTGVWTSVMKGGDLDTLSRELRRSYDVSYKRAALIARDQNAKAKAIIENARRQELGIKYAIWQHSHAGLVPRPTHVAMNGKRFEIGKGMWDSDEGEWIWPGTLINCRCTSRAILAGMS